MAKDKSIELDRKTEGLRRMKIRKERRLYNYLHPPSRKRRGFTCEMGYGDCEERGYCNGDC